MRVLVGLGNPGPQYDGTRHNVGFVCVDAVAAALGDARWKTFKDSLVASCLLPNGEKALLVKPQQFMNNSGVAVQQVLGYYNLEPDQLAIALDDVYIEPGSARIRQSGGDGGHNGLKSVIAHTDPDTFWRIKIGVGLFGQAKTDRIRQPALEDYVLHKPPAHDAKQIAGIIDELVPNLIEWLQHGTGLHQHTVRI